MKKGKCMSIIEYVELLKYIDENHSFGRLKGKKIKYIEHIFDFRTNEIFCIKLRPICSDEVIFSITNENRDKDLKEWIYQWLKEE